MSERMSIIIVYISNIDTDTISMYHYFYYYHYQSFNNYYFLLLKQGAYAVLLEDDSEIIKEFYEQVTEEEWNDLLPNPIPSLRLFVCFSISIYEHAKKYFFYNLLTSMFPNQ